MELKDVINQMIGEGMQAAQLTDLAIGTVVGISPLEISINSSMDSIRVPALMLTSAVVEKKLTALAHTHAVSEGTCGPALEQVACYDNGSALPSAPGYITLNRGLAVGDKVLMLRAQRGQKYVVLSRLYG